MSVGHIGPNLLSQAINGDRAALSQALLLHYDSLRSHIAGRISGELKRAVDADDILHQTMVRAAQGISRFEPKHEGAFRGWLKTIADNLIKDAQKRKRRERRDTRQGTGQNSSWAALVDRIAGDGASPSVNTQHNDNVRLLRSALASLPDEHREIIERYYLRGESLDEIAEALGAAKGAVRAKCYRARIRLRELMGRSSLYFSG